MRKLILLTVVLVSSLLFSGCAGMTYGTRIGKGLSDSKTGFEYAAYKTDEGDYLINADILSKNKTLYKKYNKIYGGFNAKSAKAAQKKKEVFYAYLRAAAKETKKMGYDYFAITNPEINNLGGFPINNFNDFVRYATLEDRKANFDTLQKSFNYRGLINAASEINLRFVPVSKKVYDTGVYSLWKVSDFL